MLNILLIPLLLSAICHGQPQGMDKPFQETHDNFEITIANFDHIQLHLGLINNKQEKKIEHITSTSAIDFDGKYWFNNLKIGLTNNLVHDQAIAKTGDLLAQSFYKGSHIQTQLHYTKLNTHNPFSLNFIPTQVASIRAGHQSQINTRNQTTFESFLVILKEDQRQVFLENQNIHYETGLELFIDNHNGLDKNLHFSLSNEDNQLTHLQAGITIYLVKRPKTYTLGAKDYTLFKNQNEVFHPTHLEIRYPEILDMMDQDIDGL